MIGIFTRLTFLWALKKHLCRTLDKAPRTSSDKFESRERVEKKRYWWNWQESLRGEASQQSVFAGEYTKRILSFLYYFFDWNNSAAIKKWTAFPTNSTSPSLPLLILSLFFVGLQGILSLWGIFLALARFFFFFCCSMRFSFIYRMLVLWVHIIILLTH